MQNNIRNILIFGCFVIQFLLKAQSNSYPIILTKTDESCSKGAAIVQIDSIKTNDTLTLKWSNGEKNVLSIANLDAGDYSVQIKIKNKKDTTINFKVDKVECPVIISNHFTPNGDNYNDRWEIFNVYKFPKFEVFVFNKWGQEIHNQKNNYVPWDGTWQGIAVADGTYYYVFYFEANNKKNYLKGSVTILR